MASARRAVLGNAHFTPSNVKGICSDASKLNCAASLRPGEADARECKMLVEKTVGTIFGRRRQRWAYNKGPLIYLTSTVSSFLFFGLSY